MLQQEILGGLQELARLNHRAQIKKDFEESPNDDAPWEEAYRAVWLEQQEPGCLEVPAEFKVADDIPAAELIEMAALVRATDPADRYGLTTGRASSGRLWFDILQGFSSPWVEDRLFHALAGLTGYTRSRRALDLGTGTAKSLEKMQILAHEAVGLDRDRQVLDVAKDRLAANGWLVQADVGSLPFRPGSFDIISSAGLSTNLPASTMDAMLPEIQRVLVPGGVYAEVRLSQDDAGRWPAEMFWSTATAKGLLASMIVNTISGKHEDHPIYTVGGRTHVAEQIGLRVTNYTLFDDDAGEGMGEAWVLTKPEE